MPTPLPARAPGVIERTAREGSKPGIVPSGTSTKLEASDPSQSGVLEPGTVIAERYRIDALIGEGGMGKVYSAEHVHMRKQVAVKVLHPEMSTTPEIVARFEREAIAAGKIAHPNVAAATDFGRLPNQSFFLVLEYVAGTDLRAVVRQGAVSPERALHLVRQITAAVGAAHAAGVVHRDLKPENIMLVDRDGEADFVKVLDFGIAKIEAMGMAESSANTASGPSAAQPLTKMGAVFGTPDYMSPEQALGQTIDARSDLYSIGVMLYELLTGERPFKGGAVTLMRKHVLEDAPSLPAELLKSVDPRFDVIIHKLLQKSAQDRYASAIELGQTLGELVLPKPAEPAPATRGGSSPALVAAPVSREGEPRESAGVAEPSEVATPPKRRGPFGFAFLTVTALGALALYGLGILSPRQVWTNLWSRFAPTLAAPSTEKAASAPPSSEAVSPEPASGGGSAALALPPDTASAPAADSAAPNDLDELTASTSDDPAGSALANGSPTSAGGAPRHGGPHVQGRPASKPIHKPIKPAATPQKHSAPFIPPPSQWFKN
jgi:serine/threonine-protein kinase